MAAMTLDEWQEDYKRRVSEGECVEGCGRNAKGLPGQRCVVCQVAIEQKGDGK